MVCRDEVSHLQTAWHTAREEALTARNAATRRSALEKEIEELQGNKLVLEHDAKASSTEVEPLKAQRDQRSRCHISLISGIGAHATPSLTASCVRH